MGIYNYNYRDASIIIDQVVRYYYSVSIVRCPKPSKTVQRPDTPKYMK